ncbi:Sec-independent protein translocase subunit TatA [Streptomyces sp. Ru73]|uniref:Sec-independent protein translocase subunit TatA n=1 Tax=Streptomyces sp. Ru73 TaxID=2080748 RepID=UPI0021565DF1|nr:Sec-independent protein translocase subunit TatA [Streptomyces sp. Ru73]
MFLRNGLEPWHLLIVAIVLVLLFGSKKLPDTARALGKSLRILKSETKAMKDDEQRQATHEPATAYEVAADRETAAAHDPARTESPAAAHRPAGGGTVRS